MNAREIAEHHPILRGLVGSTVHGLAARDQVARDEMGICIEPWQHFFGMRERFEQWTFRTRPEGERSGPGDLDLIVYSLAKWVKLALDGHPAVLLLLFLPEEHVTLQTFEGRELRKQSAWFVGDTVIDRYLGSMRQQRDRLTSPTKPPNRPELVEHFGFDTLNAGHLLRLGYQGLELVESGHLVLPMPEPARARVIGVRSGRVQLPEVLAEAEDLMARLQAHKDKGTLGSPNRAAAEQFVIRSYMTAHPALR